MLSDTLYKIAAEMDQETLGSGAIMLRGIRTKALGYVQQGQASTPVSWSFSGQSGASQVSVTPDVMLQEVQRAIDMLANGLDDESPLVTFPVFSPQL